MAELDTVINHWKTTLFHDAYLINPSSKYLIEETIRQLEFLKTLHPDGRFSADKPKKGGD